MNSRSPVMLRGVEPVSETNPWVRSTGEAAPAPVAVAPQATGPVTVTAPHAGVPAPAPGERLPQRPTSSTATLWWLGVHGGAGETSLARLAVGTQAAGHAWPMSTMPGIPSRVVLVARTHYAGLMAAQQAAREWASGSLGDAVRLDGLLLVPDQPGRLPKPLRQLAQLVAGGVPRSWTAPWVDAWRFGPIDLSVELPRGLSALFSDLSLLPSVSRT